MTTLGPRAIVAATTGVVAGAAALTLGTVLVPVVATANGASTSDTRPAVTTSNGTEAGGSTNQPGGRSVEDETSVRDAVAIVRAPEAEEEISEKAGSSPTSPEANRGNGNSGNSGDRAIPAAAG